MTCPTQKAMPPGYFARLSECEKADIYEEALLALGTGQNKVQVRHDTYWIQYGAGSTTYLERALARSRAICGKRTAITIERTPIGMMPRRYY